MRMFRNDALNKLAIVMHALHKGLTVESALTEPDKRGILWRERFAIGEFNGERRVLMQVEWTDRMGVAHPARYEPVIWSIDDALQTFAEWKSAEIDALPAIDNGPKGQLRPRWFTSLVDLDLGEVLTIPAGRFQLRRDPSSPAGLVVFGMTPRAPEAGRDQQSFEDLCLIPEFD